ncbi:MAG: PIN domain-containing protein [Clostridia bacterium]|nr:PIN domain-containing protein [Clostridia bacterium]
MKILDANMILRYMMNDNITMADEVDRIIKTQEVLILPEVISEVIYVANKVYGLQRVQIVSDLLNFLKTDNIRTNCGNVLYQGIKLYGEVSLDFVDCLLCAYHTVAGYEICTFDKKLNNLIKREDEK